MNIYCLINIWMQIWSLVYDKSKNTKFRDNVLMHYGADGDHRNIILNNIVHVLGFKKKIY